MKNLFFTAIAMMAFSFAGNATNSVKSTNLKNTVTIKSTTSIDDCTWTQVANKAKKVIGADGQVYWVVTQIWKCI